MFSGCLLPAADGRLSVSLDTAIPSPAPLGATVQWTATLSNPSPGTHWYRFIIRSFNEPHRVVKDYGPDNTFDWVPAEREGFYAIEVAARNRNTGEEAEAVVPYQVTSNVRGSQPVIKPTSHPLVFLYSAPVCPVGASMTVYFLDPAANILQNTPPKRCDGVFSMNFYIAGVQSQTFYYLKHIVFDHGSYVEGPLMDFTSGAPPADLPQHVVVQRSAIPTAQRVLLAGSLFTKFVATDLNGNLIWYYPQTLLFLTRPVRGGYFLGIHEDHSGDQSKQIVRMFDLTGTTVFETNAARVNEQLIALGKRPISAFHHEARILSDGRILVLASNEQILDDVQGPGPVNIVGDMIIVLNRDLEVVWTWDGFDHLDVRRAATQDDKCDPQSCPPLFLASTGNDWLHGNSLAETPDGDLLFSIRSQDWVIKIDYRKGAGSGQVLWRLGKDGDFTIQSSDPSPWFSHQHDPEFEADGTLTVFDNGNLRRGSDAGANSRGQVYRLDEKNRVAELVLNADLGQYAFALGSAEKLENGNYFFDAGFRVGARGIAIEVDPSGTPVFAIESSVPVYRTFRMKDMYTP